MDDDDAMLVASEIQRKLEASLADISVTTVVFSREEAILTLGLITALIDAMENDIAARSGRLN